MEKRRRRVGQEHTFMKEPERVKGKRGMNVRRWKAWKKGGYRERKGRQKNKWKNDDSLKSMREKSEKLKKSERNKTWRVK